MDSDPSPAVNLEVTVPVLPTGLHRHEPIQAVATRQDSESNESEEAEQVRVIGLQHDPSLHQPREHHTAIGAVPARMIHSVLFRVFHLTAPAQGQPFLLQVLRRYNKYTGKKRRKRNQTKEVNAQIRSLSMTDAMAFSVEFRSSNEIVETTVASSTPTSTPTLTPGMNRVVIYLDNEGTPAGYSIDGAES